MRIKLIDLIYNFDLRPEAATGDSQVLSLSYLINRVLAD